MSNQKKKKSRIREGNPRSHRPGVKNLRIIEGLNPVSVNSVPGLDDGLGGGAGEDPSHPLCDALFRRVAKSMSQVNTSLHYAKYLSSI